MMKSRLTYGTSILEKNSTLNSLLMNKEQYGTGQSTFTGHCNLCVV